MAVKWLYIELIKNIKRPLRTRKLELLIMAACRKNRVTTKSEQKMKPKDMLKLFKYLGIGEEEQEIEFFKRYEQISNADNIHKSKALTKWAKTIKERDGYICQRCLKNKRQMYAHHAIPLRKDSSKAFLLENGRTLCLFCHMIEDHYFEKRMLSNLYKMKDKNFDDDILRYIKERKIKTEIPP